MHKYHFDLHIRKFLNNKYNDLLVADTFRMVALSLVSLFIPIFLLEKGFDIISICYYELALFVTSIICHYFVLAHLPDWGVKKSMIISYLLNVVFYITLYFSEFLIIDFGQGGFLVFLTIFNVVSTALYWSAHHVFFIESTEAGNEGKKLGMLTSIPTILCIASPFIGSVMIEKLSFYSVFIVSIIMLVIASFILSFSPDIKVKAELNINKIIDWPHMRKNFIFAFQGIGYAATAFLWPVLLFLLAIKLVSLGFLYLFSNIVNALTLYLGGKNSDVKGSRRIGQIGAAGHGLSLVFRAISNTIFTMTAFQTMGGFFSGLLDVALDASFFKNSHQDAANAIMNREFYMYLGRILLIIILLICLKFFTVSEAFIISLVFAGIATFVLNIIIKGDRYIIK